MIETEAKLRVETFSSVKRALKALGAKPVAKAVERDLYFQHPSRDFAETDEALRLRIDSTGRHSLTYKGPRRHGRLKVREEWSIHVDSPRGARQILRRVGFTPMMSILKSRDAWELRGVKVYLDAVQGLGCFIEVEAPANLRDQSAERLVEDTIKQLGLGREQLIRQSYLELALQRNKRQARRAKP